MKGILVNVVNINKFQVCLQFDFFFLDAELRKLVEGVETCADGTIEFNEFLQMMSKKLKKIGNKDELKEAFKWVNFFFKLLCNPIRLFGQIKVSASFQIDTSLLKASAGLQIDPRILKTKTDQSTPKTKWHLRN